MKKLAPCLLVAVATACVALPLPAQILANFANNYQTGTNGSVMTPLPDTHGTGTWTYDLGFVNTTTSPSSVSGLQALTFQSNSVGGSTPYYGTTDSNSYNVITLPIVSNGIIFPDGSPAPAAGFLQVHPGGGNAAFVTQWTAGAGESGNLKLSFDLSRVGVKPPGPTEGTPGTGAGFDDFTVYRNGTLIYSDYDMYTGSNTGVVNLTLAGVTLGDTLDFVVSSTGGVLGNNMSYLSASIAEVPEPGTWALMLGGLGLLVLVQRTRKKNALR